MMNIKTVNIGKQGENNATQIEFDLKPFADKYGNGTAQLLHQRSGDNVPYIVNLTQSGNTATWNVTEDDTAYSGYGRGQLNYYVNSVLAKSVVFTTVCAESLTDETATPEKVKSDLELIAENVNKKLEPQNIIAGENISIEVDGLNITINSTGGVSDAYTKAETDALLETKQDKGDYATSTELGAEETARQNADNALQGQIDAITVSSDVIDVLGTYTDLQNYDTQHVKANDIIKVMQDSTHNDAISYYRWVITVNVGAWVYVGSEGPYYTKSEANQNFQAKLTAGENITIENNVISAQAVTDYRDLLNKPREPYTPETEVVDFLDLADGKVYDAMDDFTLAKYSGGSVITSIDVHAGDMFSVSEYDSTDGYSMIALFCNQGVFSFQSNLSDWSNGYLPNAQDLIDTLPVFKLPTEALNNVEYCDVTTLAEGVYYADTAVTLTGFTNSGTLNVSRFSQVRKLGTTLLINYETITGYDLSTATKMFVETGDIVQTTGQNTDKVVSQKAWTDNLGLEVL